MRTRKKKGKAQVVLESMLRKLQRARRERKPHVVLKSMRRKLQQMRKKKERPQVVLTSMRQKMPKRMRKKKPSGVLKSIRRQRQRITRKKAQVLLKSMWRKIAPPGHAMLWEWRCSDGITRKFLIAERFQRLRAEDVIDITIWPGWRPASHGGDGEAAKAATDAKDK